MKARRRATKSVGDAMEAESQVDVEGDAEMAGGQGLTDDDGMTDDGFTTDGESEFGDDELPKIRMEELLDDMDDMAIEGQE